MSQKESESYLVENPMQRDTFQERSSDKSTNKQIPQASSIQPIPIVRRSLPNCPKLRARLVLEGHKYFSRFVASGEETDSTLKKLSKSTFSKYISSFEFDPYFCKFSCIKRLRNALKRLNQTKEVNLMIRRVDTINETNILYPSLYKLYRLRKVKLEFLKTMDINDQGFERIAKLIRKCYSLESLSFKFLEIEGYTSKNEWSFVSAERKLLHLEELNYFVSSGEGVVRDELIIETDHKPVRNYKLKKFFTEIGVTSEWAYVNENCQNLYKNEHIKRVRNYSNLRETSMKLIKHQIDTENLMEAFDVFAKFVHLHSFTIELLSCPLSEIEVMTFAFCISKLIQLKKFTFQLTNHSHLSDDCIFRFVSLISKMSGLIHFDLTFRNFRKFEMNTRSLDELAGKLIKGISNITCTYFKGTLYISKMIF